MNYLNTILCIIIVKPPLHSVNTSSIVSFPEGGGIYSLKEMVRLRYLFFEGDGAVAAAGFVFYFPCAVL